MARKDGKKDVKSDKKMIKKEVEEYSADESPESGSSVSFSPTPEPKRTKAGGSTRPRPKKRNLIRWNEVYDQRCLLALQHVLSTEGIKIPWDKVGAKLGPTITEGAIVQHLAKLRNRLESEGVEVTPALQRGGRVRTHRATVSNNVKTVSAKGAVAKRTGNATASNKNSSRTDDNKDKFKSGDNSSYKTEAKAAVKNEKIGDNPKSGQEAVIKTEQHSSDDLKITSGRLLYDNDDDSESIGSKDTTHYSSESEEDQKQDAVAIGASFLELESSDRSSVAISAVNTPVRRMGTTPPRSLVFNFLIGHTMAQRLAQSEENNRIEERRNLVGGGFGEDGHATASGSLGHQAQWVPGQAVIEGPLNTYTEYGVGDSAALEQDNLSLAMSATPGSINREGIVPNAQSGFAGYGMQNGLFHHDIGPAPGPQYGSDFQYHGLHGQGIDFANGPLNNTGMENPMNDFRYSVDDSFRYANDSNTAGFSNANFFGYPYQNNPGFPMSNERSTTGTMAPSNVSGYLNSSNAQSSHANHANAGFNSASNSGHPTINEEVAGMNVDQFMGNMNRLNYNLNSSEPGTWGSLDHPNYPL